MGTINAWERFYKSNFEISKDKSAVDIDSIAYVVQEYLFSSKASFDIFDCDMSDRIMFYDFMSLAKYFVNSLGSDFYEATLKGYINNLRQQKNGFQSYDTIEYTKDNNAIIVYNASSELVVSLLWTTYLYCLTRYRIKNTQTWLDKSNKIYDLMRENYPYVEPAFKERSPVKYTEEAVKMLVERINSKKEKENQTAETSKEKNDDIEKLKARIAELEAQLNAQEQNVSDKREQKLTEDNQLEKEKDQEIIRLKNDLEAFKTQNGKNRMTASQAAMFLLTVCHNLGKLPNDKKKLTPILERVWNFTEATASRALGSKPSQDVADETASIFESVSPKLARLIKEFPQTFEAIRLSKLKANNDKKLNNTKEEPK